MSVWGPLDNLLREREQRLVRAIRLARNRDYDGGPCWCWVDVEAGHNHDSDCAELRAILAAAAPAAVAREPLGEGE